MMQSLAINDAVFRAWRGCADRPRPRPRRYRQRLSNRRPPATPMPMPMAMPAPAIAPMPPVPPERDRDFNFDFKYDFDFNDRIQEARNARSLPGTALLRRRTVSPKAFRWRSGLAFAPQIAGFKRNASDDRLYDAGQSALENRHWDEALEDFNQVASRGGTRADGAWYWKAYTLNKLGRRDEALAAIAELRKSFPNSRWLDDAKALELEVKQASGQKVAPEASPTKSSSLWPSTASCSPIPTAPSPCSRSSFKRAVAQAEAQRPVRAGRQQLAPRPAAARTDRPRQGNPDLQLNAISYMGERRSQNPNASQVLSEIYASRPISP